MTDSVTMVVLTKSSKYGGYCVAGLDVSTGQWVRLVSTDAKKNGALAAWDVQYEDNRFCEPLDVVKVPVLNCQPEPFQPENVLIDTSQRWHFLKKTNLQRLTLWHPLEDYRFLFGNTASALTENEISSLGHSLLMVRVSGLTLTHPDNRSTKADFVFNLVSYHNISVTDPNFYTAPDGARIDDAVIVMSLPSIPFRGLYYKFIAKIFRL